MAKLLITDAIWEQVRKQLPTSSRTLRRRRPGRQPLPDRAALTGILFVLKSGIPWEELPVEMGCGSGMTCLRRLREWQQIGAWNKIQIVLMRGLPTATDVDWLRAEAEPTGALRPRAPSERSPQRTLAQRARGGPATSPRRAAGRRLGPRSV